MPDDEQSWSQIASDRMAGADLSIVLIAATLNRLIKLLEIDGKINSKVLKDYVNAVKKQMVESEVVKTNEKLSNQVNDIANLITSTVASDNENE